MGEKKGELILGCKECGRLSIVVDGWCWKCAAERYRWELRNRDERYRVLPAAGVNDAEEFSPFTEDE